MAVHLTRIYTRTGDDGTTGLADFSRVSKTDPRLVAYADCDETNAALGLVIALGAPPAPMATVIARIQNELFDLGADLATPIDPDPKYPPLRVTQDYIDRLEADCDEFNEALDAVDVVHPAGRNTAAAALLHLARTVARRAERSAWALRQADPDGSNPLAAQYLNRLSDLLFILSRVANPDGDVLWVPGGERASRAEMATAATRQGLRIPRWNSRTELVAGGSDSSQDRRPVSASSRSASSSLRTAVGTSHDHRIHRQQIGFGADQRSTLTQSEGFAVQLAGGAGQAARTSGTAGIRCRGTCPGRAPSPGRQGSLVLRQQMSIAPDRLNAERRTAITMIATITTTRIARPTPWASDTKSIGAMSGSAANSDVVAGGEQLGSSTAQLCFGLRRIASAGLGLFVGGPGLGDVDLVGQLGVLGEDRHPVLGDGQEPAVHRHPSTLPLGSMIRAAKPSRSCASSGEWPDMTPMSPSTVRATTICALPL